MKLESEAQLARQLGVSVHTLRHALSILAHKGLIQRRHGSGTYMTDQRQKKNVVRAAFEAFCSAMAEQGAPIRPEWIRRRAPVTPGAGWEQFFEIWTARDEKADGLLVTDDMLFRDVALGILDTGVKVPSQLQVVAHANKGSGLMSFFPVTFLEVDPQDYAEAMVDLLSQLMKKEPLREPVRLIHARLIPATAQQQPVRVQQNVETQNG